MRSCPAGLAGSRNLPGHPFTVCARAVCGRVSSFAQLRLQAVTPHALFLQKLHLEMLTDQPRTTKYHHVILQNRESLRGKVILDVGCGTGIISLFCAHHAQPKAVSAQQAPSGFRLLAGRAARPCRGLSEPQAASSWPAQVEGVRASARGERVCETFVSGKCRNTSTRRSPSKGRPRAEQ